MNTQELRKSLETESGELKWQELEPHFARGIVRIISNNLNLIDIAIDIAQNNTDAISKNLSSNGVSEPTDHQATTWQQNNTSFLCVVIAPFVLVQELLSNQT
ncbi:hypothetical protein MNBD_GAMMA22-2791 [hydrothermal vent metagenome]|uniref:Uncharacterized protein n=1 Tax=hydrothermal vent metagenome TaxID=652676 RepID=A0A3B1A0A9_9ZZZZ